HKRPSARTVRMATPEDSHVLRQLIDQIDGELSTFNTVGAGSDQSLTSFSTSQVEEDHRSR
ncbi:hypothetical protein BGX30_004771, partial [Mortierella sp. GBA39]